MLWTRSLVALLVCWSAASAGHWPQWLGPNRDGVSSEIVPPWKAAPRVVWRGPVGEGNSSPVVADGRVFLHAKVKDKDEEEVLVLDARNGKELWHFPAGSALRGAPISYSVGGRQFVAVVTDSTLLTFALPAQGAAQGLGNEPAR